MKIDLLQNISIRKSGKLIGCLMKELTEISLKSQNQTKTSTSAKHQLITKVGNLFQKTYQNDGSNTNTPIF